MLSGLIILHVVICILLTVTVLVQFGKGAEAGAMMGGGSSQAVFTSSSKGNFFTKMTTFLAIAFMVNSVVLTSLTSKSSKESIFDDEAPVAAPLNNDAANAGSVIPTDAPTTSPTNETAPVTSEDKK
jgi:preprotein translocase subunit SecG